MTLDADDRWVGTEAFDAAIARGEVPLAVPVFVGGAPDALTVSIAVIDRIAATLADPDPKVRARLLVGLLGLARDRIRQGCAGEGIAPA